MEGENKMNQQNPQMICALKENKRKACLMEGAEERKTTQVLYFRVTETAAFELKKLSNENKQTFFYWLKYSKQILLSKSDPQMNCIFPMEMPFLFFY